VCSSCSRSPSRGVCGEGADPSHRRSSGLVDARQRVGALPAAPRTGRARPPRGDRPGYLRPGRGPRRATREDHALDPFPDGGAAPVRAVRTGRPGRDRPAHDRGHRAWRPAPRQYASVGGERRGHTGPAGRAGDAPPHALAGGAAAKRRRRQAGDRVARRDVGGRRAHAGHACRPRGTTRGDLLPRAGLPGGSRARRRHRLPPGPPGGDRVDDPARPSPRPGRAAAHRSRDQRPVRRAAEGGDAALPQLRRPRPGPPAGGRRRSRARRRRGPGGRGPDRPVGAHGVVAAEDVVAAAAAVAAGGVRRRGGLSSAAGTGRVPACREPGRS
jgi:hypothetical protein